MTLVAAGLTLAGCGRKGALDPPPSAATPAAPTEGVAPGEQPEHQAGIDDDGRPIAPASKREHFFLDWLIN